MTDEVLEKENKVEEKIEKESPVIDFSSIDENSDKEYVAKAKEVKANIIAQLEIRVLELIGGIACLILTTKTGVLGTFLFMAAIFYLVPEGLVKSIAYLFRLRHYEDYVESNDYKVSGGYLTVVMDAIREKGIFNAGKK